jgi:hypothetical protein
MGLTNAKLLLIRMASPNKIGLATTKSAAKICFELHKKSFSPKKFFFESGLVLFFHEQRSMLIFHGD